MVGYWNGPEARTWAPTMAIPSRNAERNPWTPRTPTKSVMTSSATTVPLMTIPMSTERSRRGDPAPTSVRPNTAAIVAYRTAMCSALVRYDGAARAAMMDVITKPIQGRSSRIGSAGHVQLRTTDHDASSNTAARVASTVVNDCPGSVTNGRSASNGATATSARTPARATRSTSTRRPASALVASPTWRSSCPAIAPATDMGVATRSSKNLATERRPGRRHTWCIVATQPSTFRRLFRAELKIVRDVGATPQLRRLRTPKHPFRK